MFQFLFDHRPVKTRRRKRHEDDNCFAVIFYNFRRPGVSGLHRQCQSTGVFHRYLHRRLLLRRAEDAAGHRDQRRRQVPEGALYERLLNAN